MDISQFNIGANIVPASGAISITPDDGANLSRPIRALYVGTSGNVSATFADGTMVSLVGLVAGLLYPFQLIKVNSTGTTAGSLVGVY